MNDLDRQDNESIYDYEERLVKHFCGDDACLKRTSNGAPWMMPCTKQQGHDGVCEFNCQNILHVPARRKQAMTDAQLHAIVMDLIRRLESAESTAAQIYSQQNEFNSELIRRVETLEQNIERLNYRSALETIPSDATTTETFSEVKDN